MIEDPKKEKSKFIEDAKREKAEFEAIFDEEVAAYLVDEGFTERGKSLYRFRFNVTVGLIRLGGRMLTTGGVSWVLALRHPYVSKHTPEEPAGRTPLYREEFPFQFSPIGIAIGKLEKKYDPSYIYDGGYDVYEFLGEYPDTIRAEMKQLREYLLTDFMPWANKFSAEDAIAELEESGRGMWAEAFWIKQYQKHIAAEQADDGGRDK